jgi:hypothetical protein
MSMSPDTSRSHYTDALDLMIMSVYKPDSELRMEARDLGCLDELMNIRENVLEYLHNARKDRL